MFILLLHLLIRSVWSGWSDGSVGGEGRESWSVSGNPHRKITKIIMTISILIIMIIMTISILIILIIMTISILIIMIILTNRSGRMSGCRYNYKERWLLRLRLPGKQEPRWWWWCWWGWWSSGWWWGWSCWWWVLRLPEKREPRWSRVTKSENFPDSKIFVTKTFRIKRVNRANFQIWTQDQTFSILQILNWRLWPCEPKAWCQI